jgi:uncharacterized protein
MPVDASQRSFAPGPVVSVIGEAVLRCEPDEAVVAVSLSALADAPGPALEDVAVRSRRLVTMLDDLSIAAADRTTTGVSVQEEFDHTAEGRRTLGHRAVTTMLVRLTDAALIGRLVTRATTELDARVDGPRWQITADNPIRLDAARAAAADGRRRAQAYAEGVGARLGELLALVEPATVTPGIRRSGRALSAAPELSVDAGEQQVSATVEVTFALVP